MRLLQPTLTVDDYNEFVLPAIDRGDITEHVDDVPDNLGYIHNLFFTILQEKGKRFWVSGWKYPNKPAFISCVEC